MVPMIAALLALFFYLFSESIFAGYGAKLCKNDPDFICYKVKRGESWKKLFPDEAQRDVVMRINRMNTRIHSGMTIALPINHNITLMDAAPFDQQIEAPGGKVIFVSINKLAWGAYDSSGTLIHWGPISAGKAYCPDIGRGCSTSTGNFTIYRKGGSSCKSTKYPVDRGGAPMPYCMFFNGGFALHGSYDVPGYNASHGCVRMYVDDAEWLNKEFVAEDDVRVVVQKI